VNTPAVFTLENLRVWKDSAPLQLAVLGDPVAHSASPPMHMAALGACGLSHTYGRIHIRPEELPEAICLLTESAFIGVNLTIPHKTAILPLLNTVDPHAKVMRAVNTVLFKEGRLTGYNTDGKGLTRAIAEDFGVKLGALRVLILGAGGGAGRAVALQCALEGCPKITLVNRTREKAEALAHEIASLAGLPQPPPIITALGTDSVTLSAHMEATDIILQCSSLGMKKGDPSPLPLRFLRSEHLVYDTIYSRPTQLLADAHAAGARSSNGLSMLLHQGALAFEIWFQREAPVDAMRGALRLFRAAASR
jgi:shikimate dehydrogenase